jgi:hypothetical protein
LDRRTVHRRAFSAKEYRHLHGTAPATPEKIQLIEGVRIHIFEHPEEMNP